MTSRTLCLLASIAFLVSSIGCGLAPQPSQHYLTSPSHSQFTQSGAQRMIAASKGRLSPVYAPLAEQIAKDFELEDKLGIGIDLGSGPGTLIVELAKRTKLYWINADVNPHFFPYFYRLAKNNGVGHRVGAVFADAHFLPFRDGYADIIVSRGSFQFWKDKDRAFGEVYRVLKPGGVAFIGRGLARDMPVKTARKVRSGQKLRYDVEKAERSLRKVMENLGIKSYTVERPQPPEAEGINYGVWLTFRKPVAE